MATQTKYTYSIMNDTLNSVVSTNSLTKQVQNSAILVALDYINTSGDELDIWFKDVLITGDETILEGLIAAHTGEAQAIPNVTADGDPHFVQENFAHVTGNSGINLPIEKFLEANTEYSEKLIIPEGRLVTLNYIEGGSPKVPTYMKIEWYIEITENAQPIFMRVNPWVRSAEVSYMKVDGAHTTGDTVLTVAESGVTLADLEVNLYYGFCLGGGVGFYRKVISKDTVNNTVTLIEGIPMDVPDNSCIGLTDRPIGQIASQAGPSASLNWVSPPTGFIGNDKNYFKVTIKNEHSEDSALAFGSVNGWHTDLSIGD